MRRGAWIVLVTAALSSWLGWSAGPRTVGAGPQSDPARDAARDAALAAPSAPLPYGSRIFEQRTYKVSPGRMENLHERFRKHTSYLFVKHGMTLVGYWTPVDQADSFVYMLAYPSLAAREASWKSFLEDPEWQRVWEETRAKVGGPLVQEVRSQILLPTDYSPIR